MIVAKFMGDRYTVNYYWQILQIAVAFFLSDSIQPTAFFFF
jgi:hypothetical protein